MISDSSDSAMPHKTVDIVNPARQYSITLRQPNVALSHPAIGVMMAVANMFSVTIQEIWSCVADRLPCICGRMTVTIRKVMPYSVCDSVTDARIAPRRKGV